MLPQAIFQKKRIIDKKETFFDIRCKKNRGGIDKKDIKF